MKQYKKQNSYYLGLNNSIDDDIKYYLYNKPHGFFFYALLNKKKYSYICKGYFNKGIIYSHWNDNNQHFNYRYFL